MNGLKQKIRSLPKDDNTLVLRRNWNNKMKRIQNNEASYEEVVQMFLGLEAGGNNISSVLEKITTQIEEFSKALDDVNQNLQGMEKENFRLNLKQASTKSKKMIKTIVEVGENKEVIELISNPETTSQMFTTLKNLWNEIMGEEESIVEAENAGWWSKVQSFASKSKNNSMKFFTFLKKAWKLVHKKYPKVSKRTMILCLALLLCGGITLMTGPIGAAACYYLGYGAGAILGLKMVISGSKYAHSKILEKRFGKKSILLQLFINSFDIYEKEKAYQEPWYQSSIETLPHLLHLYRRYILSGFKNEMRGSKLNFDKIMNQQANRYFNYLRKKFDIIQIKGPGNFEWLKKISRGYDDIFDVDQGGILINWEGDDEELKELKEEESNHLLELLQDKILTIQDVKRITQQYSTALSGGGEKKKEAMNHLINLGMDENMAAKMLNQLSMKKCYKTSNIKN